MIQGLTKAKVQQGLYRGMDAVMNGKITQDQIYNAYNSQLAKKYSMVMGKKKVENLYIQLTTNPQSLTREELYNQYVYPFWGDIMIKEV